jgi:acetyl esterase/lipase
MQRIVIVVLRLQGRKRRWSHGRRLVDAARVHNETGPFAVPGWVGTRVRLSTDGSAGFAVHTLAPLSETAGAPAILYVHGGGYIHDFARQHWLYLVSVVESSGATVLAPQYPLAPQHSWRDSFAAVVELARGVDVVMGDSAGGGYALAVAQSLAAEGVARDTVLIAPLVDLTLTSEKTAEYDTRDPWLASDGVLHCGVAWAGHDDPARAELSPLFGSFEGLGRMLVFTGTRDLLHPQAMQLQRRKPDLELVIEPECVHNYPILPIPEAKRALRHLQQFLHPQGDATGIQRLLD